MGKTRTGGKSKSPQSQDQTLQKTEGCEALNRKGDPSNWMANLPTHLLDVPLYTIAIPGSHDSGSSYLTCRKGVGPDEPWTLRILMTLFTCMCCCFAASFVKRWSICQGLNFYQQLKIGVRFFDMRVAYYKSRKCLKKDGRKKKLSSSGQHTAEEIKVSLLKSKQVIPNLCDSKEKKSASAVQSGQQKPGQDLYCLHGYYGRKIRKCMEEIKAFLVDHEKEVVLIDFNHFYEMDDDSHRDLAECLKDVFGPLLCLYSPDISLDELTLNKLWEKGTRAIVFYHEGSSVFPKECADFWPGSTMDSQSSWADTMDIDCWKKKQNEEASKRHCGKTFYVCQGILTPNRSVVVGSFCHYLFCCRCHTGIEEDCAGKIDPFLTEWIDEDVKTAQRRVIYFADFVDEDFDGTSFVQSVIQLNK